MDLPLSKNGHKKGCKCHICDNIRNKMSRGGYEKQKTHKLNKFNGHFVGCKCMFCVKTRKKRKVRFKH